MVEAAAEANEELMNKYLEEGELTEEEINFGMRTRTIARRNSADVVWLRVQEQGCAAYAGRRHRIHAIASGFKAVKGFG
jgi:translation elongation factor EF-G